VKKGILFSFILILLISGLNIVYLNIAQTNWEYFQEEKRLDVFAQENNEVEYFFVGDSHVKQAIIENEIPNSYNFAVGGETFVESYYRLKDLIDSNQLNIKNIMLQTDVHVFFKKNESLFEENLYFEKFLTLKEMSVINNKNLISMYIYRYSPIIGLGNMILRVYGNIFDEDTIILDDVELDMKITYFQTDHINSNEIEYYFKIISLAETNNIPIILIQYPVAKKYHEELIKQNIPYRTEYFPYILSLLDSKNKDLPLLDYYDYFFENPNYFIDSGHLKLKPAKIFSEKVLDDLQEI
jgi:hypothetical protein